jgi:hypothetical protein
MDASPGRAMVRLVRTVQTTPDRMVKEDGSVNFGTYRTPFRDANILDAPLYAFPVPRFWKRFRLKEWQHFGIITPSHYFGMVIFDAKLAGMSFFYAYDRTSGTRFEHARRKIGRSAQVAGQVYDGVCRFDAKGYHLRFENKVDEGCHRLLVDIDGHQELPSIKGEVIVHEELSAVEPLVQLSPITAKRPFYTHKAVVPASGSIALGSREVALDRSTAVALIDEQKTYYPYSSFWKWATAAGRTGAGELLAFNLCQNTIADDEDFNENCVWLDGKIHCLKAARFEFDEVMKPWRMTTADAALELVFTPVGERAEKVTALCGLVRSDFHQPFGTFKGSFRDDRGIVHPIDDLFGLAEHHVTRY